MYISVFNYISTSSMVCSNSLTKPGKIPTSFNFWNVIRFSEHRFGYPCSVNLVVYSAWNVSGISARQKSSAKLFTSARGLGGSFVSSFSGSCFFLHSWSPSTSNPQASSFLEVDFFAGGLLKLGNYWSSLER